MKPTIKYLLNGEYHYATVKDIGDIEKLTTAVKTDLVSAINSLSNGGGSIPPDLLQKVEDLEAQLAEFSDGNFNELQIAKMQTVMDVSMQAMNADLQLKLDTLKQTYDAKFLQVTSDYDAKVLDIQADVTGLNNDLDATELSLIATGEKLSGIELNYTNVTTTIDEINGALSTKVESSDFELLESTVNAQETEIAQTKSSISLMAEKESLDIATGQITDMSAKLEVQAGQIASTVKKEELKRELDGLEIYAENLLTGTKDWNGWTPINPGKVSVLTNTYQHTQIQEQLGFGAYEEIDLDNLVVGKTYIASIWAKSSNIGAKPTFTIDSVANIMANINKDTFMSNEWQRFSVKFVAANTSVKVRFTTIDTVSVDISHFAGGKVEAGIVNTGWRPNESDVHNRVVSAESSIKQQADQIISVVTEQERVGEDVTRHTTSINQLSSSIELQATSLSDVQGKVSSNEASIKLNDESIKLKVEQNDIDNSVQGIKLDIRNGVLNSDFQREFADWNSVNAAFNIVEISGKKYAKITRSGLSANTVAAISTNKMPAIKGDRLMIGFDMIVDDLSSYDVKTPAMLELFSISDVRVDYKELTMAELKGILTNGKPGRLSTNYTISRDDVAKVSLRLNLYRNGSVSYTNASLQKGDIGSTEWIPAPEDSQMIQTAMKTEIEQNANDITLKASSDAVNKLSGDLTANTASLKIANDAITVQTESLEQINQKVTAHTAELVQTSELLSSKMTSTEVDTLLDGKGYASQSELKQTSDSFELAVGNLSTVVEDNIVHTSSQLVILDDQIASKVSSTDYNGVTVASMINQLPDTIKIAAKNIDINGAVTFSSFDSTTKTAFDDKATKNEVSIAQAAADAAKVEAAAAKVSATSAQTTANTATTNAATANDLLTDLASDSKITPLEKKSIKKEWEVIVSEKGKIEGEATRYNIVTEKTNYTNQYNILSTYIVPIVANWSTTVDIVGATFRTNFKNYYDARQDLLNAITTKSKSLADAAQSAANTANTAASAAQSTADTATTNAATAQTAANTANSAASAAQSTANTANSTANTANNTANTAKTSATTANNLLTDLSSDSKLTPSEKKSAKKEWDIIVSEKVKIDTEATKYSIGAEKTTFGTQYNALNTYVTPLLADLSTTTDIVGATFRTNFKNYYDARQDVLNAITTTAKSLADTANSTANTAKTNAATAQTAANTANTAAASAQATANSATTSAASAKTAADAAQATANTATTNAATAQSTANSAQTAAGTANTLLNDLASDSSLTALEKRVIKKEWDIIVSEKVKIDAEATRYSISTEKTTYNTQYTALSTYITPLLTSLTVSSAIVGTTFRTNFKNYYDARQDVLNAITSKAKTLADTATTNAATAQTAANTAKTAADTAQAAANTAQTAANTAKSTADTATTNAATAQTAANAAQSTANTATTNAATAQAAAVAAQATANTANSTANTAKTAAATAQTTANTATTNAATANDLLTDLASDSSLTAVEKKAAKKEWDVIVGEKVKIDAEATKYAIVTEKTAFGTQYNTLSTYITPLLTNLNTSSAVVGTTFRTNFKNYYDARQDILNAITTKAKTLADAAATAASTAQTAANTAKTTADTANGTANTAKTNAATAQTAANTAQTAAGVAQTAANTAQGTADIVKGVVSNFDSATINANPIFLDWAGTLPSGYTSIQGSTLAKVTSGNGMGNAVKFTVAAATDVYLSPTMVTKSPFYSYVTIEFTFMLESGTIDGAGILFRYNATANAEHLINIKSIIPSPVLNKWHTITKVIKQAAIPAGFTGYQVYPMGSWSPFGTVTAKTIQFDSLKTRQSTEQEINAYESNLMINDMSSDSKVTPVEKVQLKKEWATILSERTSLDALAATYGITTERTNMTTAYNTLNTVLNGTGGILLTMTTTSTVVGATFRGQFDDYYEKKSLLQKVINETARSLANTAQAAANTANTAAGTAQAAANTANAAISDMASDGKITPVEKVQLKKEWASMSAERTSIDGMAATFGITTDRTNMTTAYNTLNTVLNGTGGILVSMTTTSTVVGTTFRGQFDDYYEKKAILQKVISENARSLANTAQTAANTANSGVSTINGKINNAVTTIDSTGITVKDGSFYLEDESSDTKYSVVSKSNLLRDHSFELIPFVETAADSVGYNTVIANPDPIWLWQNVGSPKVYSAKASNVGDSGLFGLVSAATNSTNYLRQCVPAMLKRTFTASAFFSKSAQGVGGTPYLSLELVASDTTTSKYSTSKVFAVTTVGKISRYSIAFTIPTTVAVLDTDYIRATVRSGDANWVLVDGVQLVEGLSPVLYEPETLLFDMMNGVKGSQANSLISKYSQVGTMRVDKLMVSEYVSELIGVSSNLNNYTKPGFYYCNTSSAAATISNTPSNDAFSLFIERHAGTKQTFSTYRDTGVATWQRNFYNGIWGSWVRVDQPYEEGSNANGDYIRFENGVQLAWKLLTYTNTSGFTTNYRFNWSVGSWPATWKTLNNVQVSARLYDGSGGFGSFGAFVGKIGAGSGSVWIQAGTSGAKEITLEVFAIGRWK